MCRVYGYWVVNGMGIHSEMARNPVRKPCQGTMSALYRLIATAVTLAALTLALAVFASAARADGIDPGLWKITGQSESGGVTGPPHESMKCLTADDTRDLGATFSPIPRTVNSVCAPIERSLDGPRLSWHLVCKGQLDMELSGDFNFDSPHHYTATVRTKAAMSGAPMIDTRDTLEGQWLSACPQ
jgi:hypothetical protein